MLAFLTDLEPCRRIINQKSFYGKAKVYVDREKDEVVLKSYDTYVCTITSNGEILISELYSPTTVKHICSFLNTYYSNGPHSDKISEGFTYKDVKALADSHMMIFKGAYEHMS